MAAMAQIEIDWEEMFSPSPAREEGIYFASPSSAPHAAATRAEPVALKKIRPEPAAAKRARARAEEEGVAKASLGDEQPRGSQALHLRLEALCSELERRVGELRPGERSPVTRAAAKAAADQGQDAHSAAQNVNNFNQEDVQGENVACKNCLKPSPVLISRKKKHEQADGDCKCKRVARPSTKNDDKEPASPEEIFEVLREIPSLERADLLRAYSMFIRNDHLFRSLMVLPKDMRKDWLLMEIENQ